MGLSLDKPSGHWLGTVIVPQFVIEADNNAVCHFPFPERSRRERKVAHDVIIPNLAAIACPERS